MSASVCVCGLCLLCMMIKQTRHQTLPRKRVKKKPSIIVLTTLQCHVLKCFFYKNNRKVIENYTQSFILIRKSYILEKSVSFASLNIYN